MKAKLFGLGLFYALLHEGLIAIRQDYTKTTLSGKQVDPVKDSRPVRNLQREIVMYKKPNF